MAYFEDLSPYCYTGAPVTTRGLPVLNVGWLSRAAPFATGPVGAEFTAGLFIHCRDHHLVNLMQGWHICETCDLPVDEWLAPYHRAAEGERYMNMGNGEIRVIGEAAVYAAPALIYHYVTKHQYRPPQEFITAVLAGPRPGSDEHYALIEPHILEVYRRKAPPSSPAGA